MDLVLLRTTARIAQSVFNKMRNKMSQLENANQLSTNLEKVLIEGDLSKLNSQERIQYYNGVCSSLGLNPFTKPFDYITLNGKMTLYAKKDATEQLRRVHSISVTNLETEVKNDVYIVKCHVRDKTGRQDVATGAVSIKGLQGEALGNAYMKAESKSKRRATLSIAGLGMLDESEISSLGSRAVVNEPVADDTIPFVDSDGIKDLKISEIFPLIESKISALTDKESVDQYCNWKSKNKESLRKYLNFEPGKGALLKNIYDEKISELKEPLALEQAI